MLVLLIFLPALTGCERDRDDLDTYVKEVQARPASGIAMLPETPGARAQGADIWEKRKGERDPFAPDRASE